MAGEGGARLGGALSRWPATGVWWDLNTCTIPAGVDPSCIRGCIESALHKQIGFPSSVNMYAMGNLEYIPGDLLEKIALSGIDLIHAPCGGNNLIPFLHEWSDMHPSGYIMVISGDGTMVYPCRYSRIGCTKFCVYPKDFWPKINKITTSQVVFAKQFVWETLLTDNPSCAIEGEDEPLCMCHICHVGYNACNEFITHLKSEQHREKLFGIAPEDYDVVDHNYKPRYFCPDCNYPAYDEYNLLLHNASEEHNRKLAEKEQPQAKGCESRKRNPQEDDLFNDRNKKQAIS